MRIEAINIIGEHILKFHALKLLFIINVVFSQNSAQFEICRVNFQASLLDFS